LKGFVLTLALLAAVVFAVPASAQGPLFDSSRFSLSLGLANSWYQPLHDTDPMPQQEWKVSPRASYDLVYRTYQEPDGMTARSPLFRLTGSTAWGLDAHVLETTLGVDWVLYGGGE